MTPLPRPSMVRPVRKGKSPERRSRRAERRLRSHSRALRAERSHRGEVPPTGFPLGSRTALGGLQQTRLTRGVAASGKPLGVISALVPRPTRRGRSRRQALCLCVTSIEPSGDNGNMALNGAEVDDFSWEPPTEAETKVLQARRERQNRISSLMGDYLLRGYRMLGDTCADCGTILLQNKQRQIYCVACQELDSDVDKDNPALNAQAALSQAREHQLASALDPPSGSRPAPQPPVPRPEHCEGAAAGLKAAQGPAPPAVLPNADVMASTQEALLQKLTWASAELGSSTSLEASIQLCSLIRACAEALQSLQQLQH